MAIDNGWAQLSLPLMSYLIFQLNKLALSIDILILLSKEIYRITDAFGWDQQIRGPLFRAKSIQ